jgi:hypothetical protein
MGTPHFAPSAKFQLILQVFPTEVCKGFASKCPGGQKSVYGQTNTLIEFRASTPGLLFFLKKKGVFRIQSLNPSLFFKKKGVFRIEFRASTLLFFLKKKGGFQDRTQSLPQKGVRDPENPLFFKKKRRVEALNH